MIKFSREKVLLLHQLLAEATGGSVGVRDQGLLDSALEGAFAGFGNQEFYPTKEEKGARLGYPDFQSCLCRWQQAHWHICYAFLFRNERHSNFLYR